MSEVCTQPPPQQQQQHLLSKQSRNLSKASAAASLKQVNGNGNGGAGDTMDPEVRPFLVQLERALERELKFRGCAQPTAANSASDASSGSTITSGMRDGSAHVLRCLKVWYDLPSDVFFNAVSSIDRFLAKMKVNTS